MSISLNKINSKLYDLIDKFSLQERDVDVFQFEKMITDYHNNFEFVNNDKDIKKLYYNENFEIPRNLQLEQYNDYVINRQNIYNQWLNDKNEINTNKLANYDKFNYKVIPEIYTYDITINNNLGTGKQEPKQKPKQESKQEPKQEPKQDKAVLDKCDDKKKEECQKKGKECNPLTGRCIIPKQKIKENFKDDEGPKKDDEAGAKENEIEPKKDDDAKENKAVLDKCDDKKKEECKKKGKECNPLSGRCIIPKEKNKENFKDEMGPKKDEAVLDKCDDKRKEECKKKGKECNPETGRCIIPKKSN